MMTKIGFVAAILAFACIALVVVYKSEYQYHPKLRKSAPLGQFPFDVPQRRLQRNKRQQRNRWRKRDKNKNSKPQTNASGGGNSAFRENSSLGPHDKWRLNTANGSGLTLEVVNNLIPGSEWEKYLVASFREWVSGIPDTIKLKLLKRAFDPVCSMTSWEIKVCNGNYGKTEWKGFNRILLKGDSIVASVATMNDYYLRGMNDEEKLYSVCHEFGHGLGLAHSDENFDNQDMGNCMDYTHRHHNNMHPGRINFKALKEIYGAKMSTSDWMRYDGGRSLKDTDHKESAILLQAEIDKLSHYFKGSIDTFYKNVNDDSGWRILLKTDFSEIHERQLENGYSIRTSVLLA